MQRLSKAIDFWLLPLSMLCPWGHGRLGRFLLIAVGGLLVVGPAQAQLFEESVGKQERFETEVQTTPRDSLTKGAEEPIASAPDEEDEQRAATFVERAGFFVDASAGANFRVNTFETGQPLLEDRKPLSYSSLNLGILSTSATIGLDWTNFVDFEYESPYPQSEFQQQALAAREDRSHGLEKYTSGST